MSAFVSNNVDCAPSEANYLSVVKAEILISAVDIPFNTIDTLSANLTNPKRTFGAGITAATNFSTSVVNEQNNLLLTFAAGSQTIDFNNLSLNYSTNFFNYVEEGFMVFPMILENIIANQALTLAQRTVRVAFRTTDSTPIIYGAVGGVVGALTPAVTSPVWTIIMGDPTNSGTQDLRGATIKIKIPLDLMYKNSVPANQSVTQIVDAVSLLFALPVGSQAVYYKSKSYKTFEDHCPEGFQPLTFSEKIITSSFDLANKFKDVNDLRDSLVEQLERNRDDKADLEIESPNLNDYRILNRVSLLEGGMGKDSSNTYIVPAGLGLLASELDNANFATDISVILTDSANCVRRLKVIESGQPLQNQVLFSKTGTKKLIFHSSAALQSVLLTATNYSINNSSFDITKSTAVRGDLRLTLGNSDTEANSTQIQKIATTGRYFFIDANLKFYARQEGKLPTMKIMMKKANNGKITLSYVNC